jgi:FtsP/CotA-like multicopper oxidase with cupredoxin domain
MLTLAAGAIHLSVVQGHLDEFVPFGLLFIVAGLGQMALAVFTVERPTARLFAAGIISTLGLLAVWALSRTLGLPVGPEAWRPEALGFPDCVAASFELVSVVLFGLFVIRGPRQLQAGWSRAIYLTTVPSLLLVSALAFVGVETAINTEPMSMNMSLAQPGPGTVSVQSLIEPPGPEPVHSFTLTAQVDSIDGHSAWTYNGTVPGPELRVIQGERVRVTLNNELPDATSIHWHGLRLPNAEDGVAGLTQDAVPPGSSFTYEFVAREPGTYWYHSHQDTSKQIPRGLYGALVVEPIGGSNYDRDYAVSLGDVYDHNDADLIAANGDTGELHLDAGPGELVRLRVINAAQSDMPGFPEYAVLEGAPYTVIALDGHDLNGPQRLDAEILPIGSGQRMDLVFRMPPSGQVRLIDAGLTPVGRPSSNRGESVGLGDGAAPALDDVGQLPTFDFTTYGTPTSDPILERTTFDVDQELRISSTHGFRDGSVEAIHMLNGQASPGAAPIVVREGQVVRLRFVNETDEFHPMHLHGHVFTIVSKNGTPLAGSPIHQDSVLVGPRETWEVAFVADNPGLWMLHCHVLIHAAFGLDMMVTYEGVWTPYEAGTRSGNRAE